MRWNYLMRGLLLLFCLSLVSCGYSQNFKIEKIRLDLKRYDEAKEKERKSIGVVEVKDDLKFKGQGRQVISLRGINVGELIELTFGKVLEVPFVFDASLRLVTDSLDIEVQKRLSKRQFYHVIDEALDKIGIEVSEKEGVFFIFRKNSFQSSYGVSYSSAGAGAMQNVKAGVASGSPGAGPAGVVRESRKNCVVVGVKNVRASEIASTMKSVVKDLYASVAVVEDDARKVIVLTGEDDKIRKMKKLIEALDVHQSQVMLEAQIVEVTLTGAFQYGVEWFLSGELGGITPSIKGNFNQSLANSAIYSIVNDTGRFKFLIQAMIQEGLVKVISSPFMLVRDGKEASINVGTEVPIITSEQTNDTTAGSIYRNINYRKTGIVLKITPVVIQSGVVLSIYQESSQALTNDVSTISSPVISNRVVSTDIISKDGQSVVIGGIIQDHQEYSKTGLPGIEQIPVLGNLASFKSNSKTKTELVMVITPKIIESQSQWDLIINDLNSKFQNVKVGK